MVIKSGISQIGGKYRLRKRLLEFTPYHEFFLSMFTGASHFELNKPRCRYECFNDGESDIINYLVQIQEHQKEFDAMKQGVFGLVSQEICNRIVNGKIQPKNDLEKAYFFYYLNKLTFGAGIWKVRKKPPFKGIDPKGTSQEETKIIKEEFEIKTKGYRGITVPSLSKENTIDGKEEFELKTKGYHGLIDQKLQNPRIDAPGIEEAKNQYKKISLPMLSSGIGGGDGAGNKDNIEKAKARFRGIVLPTVGKEKSVNDAKAKYRGIQGLSNPVTKRDVGKWKKDFEKGKASYKGVNPKITRPHTNNDCGLLTPIDPEAIKRLRYVNLTAYDFARVYKMFYEAFHVRKDLNRECFVYADPPYPGTEKYYGHLFPSERHQELIDIILKTPFNFMLSIGGKCEELYIAPLEEEGWVIKPVKVKYATSANHQKESQEYICMNYEISGVAKMILPSNQKVMNKFI